MRTETTTEKLTDISSNVLTERADEISTEADKALDEDRWNDYQSLSALERRHRAELDRRRDIAEQPKAPEAPKAPSSRAEQVEQTRLALAEAEASLAAFAGVKPPGVGPPELGQSAEEAAAAPNAREAAFMNAEALKNDLAVLEQRLPFADTDDDTLAVELEDVQIRVEDLRKDAKRFEADGRRAAAGKATRELGETNARLRELLGENDIRRQERGRETTLDEFAARKALRDRKTNLDGWKARVKQLEATLNSEIREGESPHFDMEPLRTATKNVELLQKAVTQNLPLEPDEFAHVRAELDAQSPRPRAFWAR